MTFLDLRCLYKQCMCDVGSGEACRFGIGFQALMKGDKVKLFDRWRITENMAAEERTGNLWKSLKHEELSPVYKILSLIVPEIKVVRGTS